MPISPRDLVKDVAEVVALPEVCTRVISMTEGTKYSAAEIAQVVGRDPGLTTQILKIANSPYYGFPSRIDTISRAVTVIGNRELRDLVLATSVINTFSHMEDAVADLNDYWRHSLYVGVVARHLAAKSRLRVLHSERLFIAGLLHDVGRLVMAMRIGELMKVMLHRSTTAAVPLHEAERQVFDLDHGEVGAELMRAWNFPKSLQEVARYHHEPEKAGQHKLEVALVHLANSIALRAGYGDEGNAEAEIHPLAWEVTGLSEDRIKSIVGAADQQYAEAVATFLPLISSR